MDELRMTLNDEDKKYIEKEIQYNNKVLNAIIKRKGTGRKTENYYYGTLFMLRWNADDDEPGECGMIKLINEELTRHTESVYFEDYSLFKKLKKKIGKKIIISVTERERGERGDRIKVYAVK